MRQKMMYVFNDTFSSLSVRNFRIYFIGQTVSVSGTFMQAVAQAWLVLKLTNSGTVLGLITALQYAPILIFGPWGGVLADRHDKLKLIFITQVLFGLQALILGILVITNVIQIWMVGLLAFVFGLINLIDNPTRNTFVPEMVGNERIRNAVTLYSALVNLARVFGPILAAILIVNVGIGMCFIFNGLSYAVIIILLMLINKHELHHGERAVRAKGQIIEGAKYIIANPPLFTTLLMMTIIGTLTYEFPVSLPLLAEFTFHGDAATYAGLTAALGVGSVIGGLLLAGQKSASTKMLVLAALFFGISTLFASFMPNIPLTTIFIGIAGLFSIYFQSLGNTILQLTSEPKMRGRVMSYWSMAFLGSTAIGGPLIGWIGQNLNARWSLGVGGIAAIAASAIGFIMIKKISKRTTNEAINAAELTANQDQRII